MCNNTPCTACTRWHHFQSKPNLGFIVLIRADIVIQRHARGRQCLSPSKAVLAVHIWSDSGQDTEKCWRLCRGSSWQRAYIYEAEP